MMLRKIYLTLTIAAILVSGTVLFAEQGRSRRPAPTAPGRQQVNRYSNLSTETLEESFDKIGQQLNGILSTDPDRGQLYKSNEELTEVVAVVSERVKRTSRWEFGIVKADPERYYEQSISVLNDYLELVVAENSPVHKAAKRISSVSLEKARQFEKKAGKMKLEKYQNRYKRMASTLSKKSKQISRMWKIIEGTKPVVEEKLALLSESRQYYNDVKATFGSEAAFKELREVANELKSISNEMIKLQNAAVEAQEIKRAPRPTKSMRVTPGRRPGKVQVIKPKKTAKPRGKHKEASEEHKHESHEKSGKSGG